MRLRRLLKIGRYRLWTVERWAWTRAYGAGMFKVTRWPTATECRIFWVLSLMRVDAHCV